MVAIIRNPAYAGSDQAPVDTSGQNIGQALNSISSAFMNTGQQDLQRAALAAQQQKALESRQKQEATSSISSVFGDYLGQQPARAQFEAQSRDAANPNWQGPMTPAPEPFSFDPARFSKDAATIGDPSMLGKVLQLGASLQGGPRAPGVAVGSAPSGDYKNTAEGIDQIARRNAEIARRAEESKPIEVMAPDGTRSFAPRNAIPVGSQPVFTGTDEAKAYSAQRYLIPQPSAPASQGESAPISGAFLSPRSTEFTPGMGTTPPSRQAPAATRASPIPQPVADWLNIDRPKFQVIGEGQYGEKKYGYPPAPGAPEATPAQPAPQTGAETLNLHGQEFLDTLDQQTQSQVKAIIDGRAPYPTGPLLRTPYGQQLAAAVTRADPTFESGNAMARVKLQNDLSTGTLGKSNNALNTAIGHLDELANAAEKLNNKSYPMLNAVGNFVGTQMGGSAVTTFNTIASKVADEVTRAYRGAGGAEADIKRELENISSSQSPEQLRAAIAATAELMRSKIQANENQARSIMGPMATLPTMIQPHAQTTLDRLSGRADVRPQGAQQPNAPVQGAKQASDGHWYVPDPARAGKFLRVDGAPQ